MALFLISIFPTGNPDRGWNDPPMFMYNLDGQRVQSSAFRKNPLTQRVGMSQNYGSTTPKIGIQKVCFYYEHLKSSKTYWDYLLEFRLCEGQVSGTFQSCFSLLVCMDFFIPFLSSVLWWCIPLFLY